MNNQTKLHKCEGIGFTERRGQLAAAIFVILMLAANAFGQNPEPAVVTSDIDNFWMAYDRIVTTGDSALQYKYLNELFIEKASPGQRAIMELKEYTPKSYLEAIGRYPLFWSSIRANTLKSKTIAAELKAEIARLQALYPQLRPAPIYFTVGALNTNGTVKDGLVLIGSEIALADAQTVTSEFPKEYAHLAPYFKENPIRNIVFLNTHEYVHTQQTTTDADSLLAQSVLEGVAEFVAVRATGRPSTAPAMQYGRTHNALIKARFEQQMYNPFTGFWLYSNAANEFNTRDLGYYVGYAICEKYYSKAKDKKRAVSEMIELDYNHAAQLNRFVDRSGYFNQSTKKLAMNYERGRPTVTRIGPFANGATGVDPKTTELVIEFSKPMNKNYRNFDVGSLGAGHALKIKRFVSFSEDGKTLTMEIELKPGARQQILVAKGFRSADGISLVPFEIGLTTEGK